MLTIRASSLAADCPKRWSCGQPGLRERIEAVAGPLKKLRPHVGAVVGGGAHAGFADLNRALRDTGEVGGTSRRRTASETAVAEVDRRYDEAGGEIENDEVTLNQERARRQVEDMTGQWHEQQTPTAMPVLIEHGLFGRVAGATITGTPDLWSMGGVLLDTKTNKRPPMMAVHAPQAGCYSMLLRARDRLMSSAALVWMPRTIKPKPIVIMPVDITTAERAAYAKIKHLARMVDLFERALDRESGDPWLDDHPTDAFEENPASLLCSPNWCVAFGTAACNSWKLKVTS